MLYCFQQRGCFIIFTIKYFKNMTIICAIITIYNIIKVSYLTIFNPLYLSEIDILFTVGSVMCLLMSYTWYKQSK